MLLSILVLTTFANALTLTNPIVRALCDKIYTVQQGDSYNSIAQGIKESGEWLQNLNQNQKLYSGLEICVTKSVRWSSNCTSIHTILSKDTCQTIASAASITLDKLKELNLDLSCELALSVGNYVCNSDQKKPVTLKTDDTSSSSSEETENPNVVPPLTVSQKYFANCYNSVPVTSNDTCESISNKYLGGNVTALKVMNPFACCLNFTASLAPKNVVCTLGHNYTLSEVSELHLLTNYTCTDSNALKSQSSSTSVSVSTTTSEPTSQTAPVVSERAPERATVPSEREPERAPETSGRRCTNCVDGNGDYFLDLHNGYRRARNIAPLEWDNNLASSAYSYAAYLATRENCQLEHSRDRQQQGENLYWNSERETQEINAMNGFMNEPLVRGNYNHRTQVLWSGTEFVGCSTYITTCGSVVVCRYSPAGNVVGEWYNDIRN